MAVAIASKTRLQIRHAIGYNKKAVIVSTWSAAGSVTTGVDTNELVSGGTVEHVGKHLQFNTPAVGEYGKKRWITACLATGTITFATLNEGTADAPASGEAYELWKSSYNINEINQLIDNAETEVVGRVFMDKEDHSTFTEDERYQYPIPTGFTHIDGVYYCSSIGNSEVIDSCDSVWTAGTNVTASIDTSIEKEGSGCAKLVVAAGAIADAIIGYHAISSLDLSDMAEVEIWIYSTQTLAAGDLELVLDDTAACVSGVESIDIPATTAYTWTRHVLTLANPSSDTAIISVGIKMKTDYAFTLYIDDILGVDANSRVWLPLHTDYWNIVHGTTPYLRLTTEGLGVTGTDKALRLTGLQKFTAMSADTSTSQVDPDFLINRVCQWLSTGDEARRYKEAADAALARNLTDWRPGQIEV